MSEIHRRPFSLHEFKIEVTYRCGLNCIHCSSDSTPSNSIQMQWADCSRILAEASALGAKKVAFSGGEPLCWQRIDDAVEAAANSGLDVTIYTSGNINDFKRKSDRISRLGARRFIFSIFGGTATSHERITRVAGSFKTTLSAMLEAQGVGLSTELHFVPISSNYRELKDVAALARKYGASIVSLLRMVPQGRAALLRQRILNRVQNLELRRQIRELRDQGYRIRTGSPYNFLMLSEKPQCYAAIDRLIIGPDLRLHPCDAFKQVKAEELCGTLDCSILNESSLQACWQKSPYLEAIRIYLTTPFEEPCSSCKFLEKCHSGCLAQKVVAFGKLKKVPDPDWLRASFQGD